MFGAQTLTFFHKRTNVSQDFAMFVLENGVSFLFGGNRQAVFSSCRIFIRTWGGGCGGSSNFCQSEKMFPVGRGEIICHLLESKLGVGVGFSSCWGRAKVSPPRPQNPDHRVSQGQTRVIFLPLKIPQFLKVEIYAFVWKL